jgi:hypothetical protein
MEKVGEARQATGDDTIWDVCFARWITTGNQTHLEYVTSTAFPWQHWLRAHTCVTFVRTLHCALNC